MANVVNRTKYYLRSLRKAPYAEYFLCPNCGADGGEVIDRKYMITSLARCPACGILYRQPITTQAEADSFYEADYKTDKTGTPQDPDHPRYQDVAFLRTIKDQSDYVRVLMDLGLAPGTRIFDYGCSWGYGTGQLKHAGFAMSGYEIDPRNRVFARDVIGIDIVDDYWAHAEAAPGAYDVWFSSHVLEHLPSVEQVLDSALRLIRPGGLIVIFVPNGSETFMQANRARWHRLWGEVHPLFLTDAYFKRRFAGMDMLIGASPISQDALAAFGMGDAPAPPSLNGKELAVILRRPPHRADG
ncbi:MAG: methyltransferase domain-containing protein [Pseudomonadota bacterium]